MADAAPWGLLATKRAGELLEFRVMVPVSGGHATYGLAALTIQEVRGLLANVRMELWAMERAQAATRATLAARGLAP